jgi:hypothetical protein
LKLANGYGRADDYGLKIANGYAHLAKYYQAKVYTSATVYVRMYVPCGRIVLTRINKNIYTRRSTRLTLQWVDSSYKKTNGYASARRLKKANKTESFFEAALLNSI